MKSNIHAARQRKLDIEKKMRAMLDAAADQNRDLNETEAAQYDDHLKSLKAATQQIEREQNLLEFERTSGTVIDDDNGTAAAAAGTPRSHVGGFKSFGEQLVSVVRSARSGINDPRLMASVSSDGSLGEAMPSEGGFLVQKEFAPEIMQRTYATGQILKRVKRLPIGGSANGMKINVVDEDSRADGSRMGGILAYWINEADALTSTRPKLRRMELNLNKLIALCYATDEILQDAATLEAWIMENLPTELAFRVEDAIFNGSGAGQPFGLLNSNAALQIAVAGGEANHFPNSTDITNMWGRFWAPGLENHIASIAEKNLTPGAAGIQTNAAWFVDQSVLTGLFGMTLGAGTAVILLYHPPGYMGLPGPYGQLLGIPVIPVEHCAAVGTPGDVILADLSQYLMIDKGAPQAASSIHVRFLTDETTFRFTYRVDGQPTWKKPLTPKSGGPTLAPFITLAAR